MDMQNDSVNVPSCIYNRYNLSYYDVVIGCTASQHLEVVYVFALVLSGIVLVAIGFVIFSKLPAIVAGIKYKRKRRRFIRHTNTRSSRSSSHGGAYFVRSQDQQSMQLPIYQNRFEYVDMLAETPTTVHTLSEENLAETTTTTLERGHDEQSASVDPLLVLYDDPDSIQTNRRERSISQRNEPQTRARSKSVNQFTRSVSHHEQTHSAVQMQRGATARESTRSMPGGALNSTRQQRQRTHTVSVNAPFQGSAPRSRERVRSLFDPLPDVPIVEILNAVDSVDAVVESEIDLIVSPNTSSELTMVSPVDNRTSQLASEKQFSFEDGTLIRNDVPSFCDPEFCDEMEVEISIYSSQILEKTHATSNSEAAVNSNTTDEELYDRLDHSLPTQPPRVPPLESERSQPEGAYSQISIKSDTPRNIEISGPLEEALYDTPIVVVTKALDGGAELRLKDIADAKNLFDDPGYTEGMMAAKLAQKQSSKRPYENITSVGESVNEKSGVIPEPVSSDESAEEEMTTNTLALQDEALGPGVSASSLSVQLDYDEEELDDLDPDIASCLTEERITFV